MAQLWLFNCFSPSSTDFPVDVDPVPAPPSPGDVDEVKSFLEMSSYEGRYPLMSGHAHEDDDEDEGVSLGVEEVSVEGGVGGVLSLPSPPCEVRPVDIE